jgi:hypothetical protein
MSVTPGFDASNQTWAAPPSTKSPTLVIVYGSPGTRNRSRDNPVGSECFAPYTNRYLMCHVCHRIWHNGNRIYSQEKCIAATLSIRSIEE